MPPLSLLHRGISGATRPPREHSRYSYRKTFSGAGERAYQSRGPRLGGPHGDDGHLHSGPQSRSLSEGSLSAGQGGFGGVHAEALPLESLSNSAVDYVVRGDGEDTFAHGERRRPLMKLNGVSWRKGNEVENNPPVEVNTDLDRMPRPRLPHGAHAHVLPHHWLLSKAARHQHVDDPRLPGQCTFCNSANTTLRSRSADKVVAEIEHLRTLRHPGNPVLRRHIHGKSQNVLRLRAHGRAQGGRELGGLHPR